LHLDWLRWAFRTGALPEAQHRYREYVRDPAGLTWSFEMTAALGTVRFQKAVGECLQRRREDRPIPLGCRLGAQVPLMHLLSGEWADTHSRDARILAAHVTHGYRLAEIARFLTVAPSTVSKALRRARSRQLSGEMTVLLPSGRVHDFTV
jgi:hypothetical protein